MTKVTMLVGSLAGDIFKCSAAEGTGMIQNFQTVQTGVPLNKIGQTVVDLARKMDVTVFPFLVACKKDINMALQNSKN